MPGHPVPGKRVREAVKRAGRWYPSSAGGADVRAVQSEGVGRQGGDLGAQHTEQVHLFSVP